MKMDEAELLKVQAYLDNELPRAEAERVAERLAGDGQAQALFEELRQIRALLAGNELEGAVPESREFYWSKIERQIQREVAPKPGRSGLWPESWLRLLLPASGVTALIALLFSLVGPEIGRISTQEIDSPHLEVNAITFHSQETGMTVVWIENQAPYWSETDSND